jgi:nondiscriminating glutamyl-tRNA synthetase
MAIRVRMAPSPTGPIHVGNCHTALFNWLFARHEGGTFILRFEDTDRERSRPEWETVIFEDLKWLGIDWDEGPDLGGAYAPYSQMKRLDLYRQYADRLLAAGAVYRCYCTKEEEDADRQEAQRQNLTYQYRGRCRNLSTEQEAAFVRDRRAPVLRFRVPRGEAMRFDDMIRGPIEIPTDSIGDFVIMRANGIPLYNFAVVVDDITMEITHIIRGEGHISNTAVQLLIYRALRESVPVIGHVGHLTNEERGKLSKRKGEAAVRDYREQGFLPEALLNFMALLGWTPPGGEAGREFLTRDELIAEFDIGRVTRAPSVFDRTKLEWMNGHYIRKKSVDEFAELALPFVTAAGLITEPGAREQWDWFKAVMAQVQPRVVTLAEVPHQVDYYLGDQYPIDQEAVRKLISDVQRQFFKRVVASLQTGEWTVSAIEAAIRALMEEMQLKPKEAIQPIRVAVTGRTASPGLFETLHLIGRERSIARLNAL